MNSTKRALFAWALNGLTVFALGGGLSTALTQTARAADQPKTPQSEYEKIYSFYAKNCDTSSKIKLSRETQRKCAAAQQRLFRSSLEQTNAENINNPAALREYAKSLKAQYLKVFKKNQDLDKSNTLAAAKNRALAAQTCHSGSQATQPEGSFTKSAGLADTPVIGEQNPEPLPVPKFDILMNIQSTQPPVTRYGPN